MSSPLDDVEVIVVQAPSVAPVLTVKVPGVQGPPGVFEIGPVTTGAPGTDAFADVVDENGIKTVSFTIPRGDVGAAANMSIGTVTTGDAGSSVQASVTGAGPNFVLNLSIPRGDKGDKGDQGIQGIQGPQGIVGPKGDAGAGIQIAGSVATYANLPTGLTSADAGKAYLVNADGKLYIWSGTSFPTNGNGTVFVGPAGPANTLTLGAVTTGTPGSAASATVTGTSPNQTLTLTIPRGDVGATGATGASGPANTLTIGTVTTGAAGGSAAATITGASPNQTLNLTIPKGADGANGATGPQGPAGAPGTGVVILGATDPVPPGTSAGTVIYRPAVKQNTYYWGSGTAYPTVGLIPGDTYLHTGLQTIMRWNNTAWRQAEPTEQSTIAARDAISTNYASLLYAGFKVLVSGTEYIWNGSRWLPDSAWINVGAAGAPAFQNSWTNYVGSYAPARYRKLASGLVMVEGVLATGTINTSAFTLPVGYRPDSSLMLATETSANVNGRLDITSAGGVVPASGSNAYFSVSASFYADA